MNSSQNEIHIAFTFDRNYIIPFYISITSIFKNKKKSKIVIHAITSNVNENEKSFIKRYATGYNCKVSFYNISNYDLEKLSVPNGSYFTHAIYYRLFLPLIIPKEIEKIIYLDTDILVIGDLSDLYNEEIGSFPVGAALDNQMHVRSDLGIHSKNDYFNSGVLLINTKLWKSKNITEKTLEFILNNDGKIKFPDQDALNFILKKNWHILDQRWNVMRIDIPELPQKALGIFLKDKIVIHYNDRFKPWNVNCDHKLKYLYDYYSLIFFESKNGKAFVETDLIFELDYIIAKAFRNKHSDIETTLLCAFACHVCWIRAMKETYPEYEIDRTLINLYQPIASADKLLVYQELLIVFENNRILLSKIYNNILETKNIEKIKPIWAQRWVKICSQVHNLKYLSNASNDSFLVVDLINKKMAISDTTRTLLYFLIGRFLAHVD